MGEISHFLLLSCRHRVRETPSPERKRKGETTMNAYSVNHVTRSIILTRDFAKAASIPDTDQYRLLIRLRTDNPGYEIVQRTITKKEGKRKPPSYKQMKKYISCVENSDYYINDLLKVFKTFFNYMKKEGYQQLCCIK